MIQPIPARPHPRYFGLGEASETAKREAQRARAEFKMLLEKGV
jgi:acetyl esterase